MKVTFIGATHEVTGSCTLIEIDKKYIMVDCGMEQGANIFENIPIPVSPSIIDCVFLTHAHIDHSGLLPLLYKNGFQGTVYATEETCNLCRIMLKDSAHIQESEAEWKTRKAKRKGGSPVEPLYTMSDAEGLIQKLRGVRYEEKVQALDQVSVRFIDAGHLLGSSSIELWLTENGVEKKIVFSGDIGNVNQPIINNPKFVKEADYVVIESTYGDRYHTIQKPDYVKELAQHIQDAFDRGGNLIIPSFAVGRTQEMLYFIREIKNAGLVKGHDGFKVYMDSPLANDATGIFLQCSHECLDEDALEIVKSGINPLVFDGLEISQSAEESKAINFDNRPKVVIAASGMCEAGRIRHHLKHNLWRRESIILFVGYQAAGTLGRLILEGAESVKLFGEEITIRSEIRFLDGKSGHADKGCLLNWMDAFEKKPHTVFVNHGEDGVMQSFADCLKNQHGFGNVLTPYSGTVYDLATDAMVHEARPVLVKKDYKPRAQDSKSHRLFMAVIDSAKRLVHIARGFEGRANRDLRKFKADIDKICDKWVD